MFITLNNDIRYITGEDNRLPESPFSLIEYITVSGPSASDPSVILSNTNIVENVGLIPEVGVPEVGESLIIQAEDLKLDGVYQVETIGSGEVIGLRDSSGNGAKVVTGEASLKADDFSLSGDYNLKISTFDENDGAGTIEVQVNGVRRGDLIALADISENPTAPNNFPNEDIRQEFTIGLGEIASGDEITILGTSDGQEFARIDFITFEELI